MATAVKHVERVITENVSVTLTLDADEAEAVLAVLARVGGDRNISHRKHVDAVLTSLIDAGVRYQDRTISRTLSGTLHFGERG